MLLMRSRVVRSLIVLLMAMPVLGIVGLAKGDASSSRDAPVVVPLKFRVAFANCPGALHDNDFASHDFLVFSCSFSRSLLVDDRTEMRVKIRNSYSCGWLEPRALGAPSVLFFCGGSDERVYNVVTGRWRRIGRAEPACVGVGGGQTLEPQSGQPVGEAVGARWVERQVQCPGPCTPDYHNTCGPIEQVFINIRTGKVRRDLPGSPTTILDLDSPTLARKLCAPLRVPPGGSITMDGRFALVRKAGGSTYLQACGSHRQTALTSPEWWNQRAVFWAVDSAGGWRGKLAGILLPSLRRFTATIPARLQSSFILLGASHLYMPDSNGKIWATQFPSTTPGTGS
jgi:hypothetical protein